MLSNMTGHGNNSRNFAVETGARLQRTGGRFIASKSGENPAGVPALSRVEPNSCGRPAAFLRRKSYKQAGSFRKVGSAFLAEIFVGKSSTADTPVSPVFYPRARRRNPSSCGPNTVNNRPLFPGKNPASAPENPGKTRKANLAISLGFCPQT